MRIKVFQLLKLASNLICCICIGSIFCAEVQAGCMDLADIPLDTLKQAAPGIVMFLIDDSGSMDWNFMTPEKDGAFEGYEYVFPNAGDDVYTTGIYSDALTGTDKMKWRSQWAGYNRLYYNPGSTYHPWPRWNQLPGSDPPDWSEAPDADPDTPRSNPVSNKYKIDLNETFYDFSDMTTQDIINAGGVIVDNRDSGFSSSGPWQTVSSGMGYGSNHLSAQSAGQYAAQWEYGGFTAGAYNVYMWWVADADRNSRSVAYEVQLGGETRTGQVNQKTNGSAWNLLISGIHIDDSARVILRHSMSSRRSDRACADAVAFVPISAMDKPNIVNAHYYSQNRNGVFLVNLNGDFEYFRVNDDGDESITADELEKMTDADAREAGIVTGRTYAEERQNFANWYSFYRRRILTAKAAIANVINSMKGVHIGLVSLHKRIAQPALPVKTTIDGVSYDYTDQLLNILYGLKDGDSTPLRLGLKDIGEYFMGKYLKPSALPAHTSDQTYPFFTDDKGGACEQAFCIAMTDGFWNDDYPGEGNTGVGNADGDHNTNFDGGNFADGYSNTLADVAMAYYETDLNRSLENAVPVNAADKARHQHMVTYGLSFGVQGTIDRTDWPDCPAGNCPAWPDPAGGNLEKIDDLYHAAINGRGKYVNASSPEELIDALDALKGDIENRLGAAAGLAANSVQRHVGSVIYQGTYYTDNWSGDLAAIPLNVRTGNAGSAIWRAAAQLDIMEADERVIFSYSGAGGIPFRYENLTDEQKLKLNPDSEIARNLVDYLRGDFTHDTENGGKFRARNSMLGDIVHSAPAYFDYGNGGAVFVGANDGMLHAFDAATGHELFAYVPNLVFGSLNRLAGAAYSHMYYVDNSPYVADTGEKVLLVCGLGKGGKGYFCLDVTDVDDLTESDSGDTVKWEYPAGLDDDLGYSYSRAYIVNTKAAGWVAVFGNGYDSVSGKAALYILDAETGELIKKFDTGVSGCNGMSTPALIDAEFDGYVDYAYAGDLKGNLWKFDLTSEKTGSWKISFTDGSNPQPLFTARNSSNVIQPITVSPEVMQSCDPGENGFMVVFGTGRFLGKTDVIDSTTQSFYGIWDWQEMWRKKLGESASRKMYLGTFTPERNLSNLLINPYLDETGKKVTLLQQTVEAETEEWRILTDHPISFYDKNSGKGKHAGWYFNLPDLRERSIRDPMILSGIAVMISSIPSDAACEAGGSSIIYQLNACTGGRTSEPEFDVDHDSMFDEKDVILGLPPTGKKEDETVFDAIELDGHLYLQNAGGWINDIGIPENPPGMTYWRVIE